MGTSKLRHTPHGRGPDDRDREIDEALAEIGQSSSPPLATSPQLPKPRFAEPTGPKPSLDDLDAPLPDSAAVAKEDRYWADIRERLERLLRDPDLSERTQAILESFDEQLTNRGFLTGNQVNTIIEIEDRRDSGKRRY